jgi:CHASE3 domain sensor protein
MHISTQQFSILRIAMLYLALLSAGAIALLSYRNIQEGEKANEQYRISQRVVNLSQEILSTLKDAETRQREFILTGEEQYLEPYNHAVGAIPELLERFETQISTSKLDQFENMRNLEPVVLAKLAELRDAVELSRSNRQMEVKKILESDRGVMLMNEIRGHCVAIDEIAKIRIAGSVAAAEKSSSILRLMSMSASILLFVFLSISAVAIFHHDAP